MSTCRVACKGCKRTTRFVVCPRCGYHQQLRRFLRVPLMGVEK